MYSVAEHRMNIHDHWNHVKALQLLDYLFKLTSLKPCMIREVKKATLAITAGVVTEQRFQSSFFETFLTGGIG